MGQLSALPDHVTLALVVCWLATQILLYRFHRQTFDTYIAYLWNQKVRMFRIAVASHK